MLSKEKSKTRQIALFSMLVAVTTAIQVLPRPWGLEFTSLLTFSTGVVFGSIFGASLGAIVMFVNAFLSPWGQAGINTPFQMSGMSVIGAVGGVYKIENDGKVRCYIESAILGAFLTFVYYTFFTNMGFALHLAFFLSKVPLLDAFVFAQINGAVVTALYIISNTWLFGFGAVPLVNAIRKVLGR